MEHRRGSIVGFGAMVTVLVGAATIGACASIPSLSFDDADSGTSPSSANTSGTGTAPAAGCQATGPERCGDGIDNDCNGRTDCADQACSGTTACAATLPPGWSVVAFAEAARPTCPAGYTQPADVSVVAGASGPPACACDCGAGACAAATLPFAMGNNASCGGVSQVLTSTSSTCRRLGNSGQFNVPSDPFFRVSPPAAPACSANPTSSMPPVTEGRVCRLDGCGALSCAPKAGAGFAVCIQKVGNVPCPSGFRSVRHVGTGANDTRACSACTCTASPCSVELKLYDKDDCSSLRLTATSDGTCNQVSNSAFNARAYEVSISGGCVAAAPPQGSGTLSFTGESTVCCP